MCLFMIPYIYFKLALASKTILSLPLSLLSLHHRKDILSQFWKPSEALLIIQVHSVANGIDLACRRTLFGPFYSLGFLFEPLDQIKKQKLDSQCLSIGNFIIFFYFFPLSCIYRIGYKTCRLDKLTPSPSPRVIRGRKMEHSIHLEEYDRNYPKLSQLQN